MDILAKKHFQIKSNIPSLHAGDRVKVHQKITEGTKERVQVFEGLVLKVQNGNGINGTFTVRRITLGVGVEKTLPLHLPSIVKIEKMKSAKVRQAKIFYVRGLIGKKARRLKKEKEDAQVWEDVAVEEVTKDPEQLKIEEEAKTTAEDLSELKEEKNAQGSQAKAEKAEEKTEEKVEVKEEKAKPQEKPADKTETDEKAE